MDGIGKSVVPILKWHQHLLSYAFWQTQDGFGSGLHVRENCLPLSCVSSELAEDVGRLPRAAGK